VAVGAKSASYAAEKTQPKYFPTVQRRIRSHADRCSRITRYDRAE